MLKSIKLPEILIFPIDYVGFCGLSILNAPCTTVPFVLPLYDSVPTDLA
jgi:hypothetical protein